MTQFEKIIFYPVLCVGTILALASVSSLFLPSKAGRMIFNILTVIQIVSVVVLWCSPLIPVKFRETFTRIGLWYLFVDMDIRAVLVFMYAAA